MGAFEPVGAEGVKDSPPRNHLLQMLRDSLVLRGIAVTRDIDSRPRADRRYIRGLIARSAARTAEPIPSRTKMGR